MPEIRSYRGILGNCIEKSENEQGCEMADNGKMPVETEFLLYTTEDGRIKIQTRMQEETVWLTLNQLAELFQVDKSGISRHLKNIFETGELDEAATVAKYATVQKEGARSVNRELEYYNLDVIISVGYRINSVRGTQFRIWASQRLKEYMVKGFAMDDDRLKQASGGGYFEELLARIRDIRSSEKVFWRKVLDIYATSVDYNKDAEITKRFFRVVQNKMHWAAHGQTAAEVIYGRADASKDNMGMTNWSGAAIHRDETEIAKNYLNEKELDILNRIVTAYLEFAEIQALNHIPMTMKAWIEKLDDFLKLSGRNLLADAGKISHDKALLKAHEEFEKYRKKKINAKSVVEKDFIEAEKELKMIEGKLKSRQQKKKRCV